MKLKDMSLEELLDKIITGSFSKPPTFEEPKAEILSRFAKGQKAIEAMEKIRELIDYNEYIDMLRQIKIIIAEYDKE